MLDPLDRAILRIVQRDNQRTHASIGAEVGLSPSSVRRRLGALRSSGVIEADVSLLAPSEAGVQAIVFVTLQEETTESDDGFRRRIRASPEVTQCYAVLGSVDYVLVVHAADLPSYEAWGRRVLLADPAVRRYDTHMVWGRVKFSTALPL